MKWNFDLTAAAFATLSKPFNRKMTGNDSLLFQQQILNFIIIF